jgi:hypothetical protein
MDDPHLLRASSGPSKVFCLRNSSMRVSVTSFSLSLDSVVEIGGVTPKYLRKDLMSSPADVSTFLMIPHPFSVAMAVARIGEYEVVNVEKRETLEFEALTALMSSCL